MNALSNKMLQTGYDNKLHHKVLHQGKNEILNCLHKERMLLLRGVPPLPLLVGVSPPPPFTAGYAQGVGSDTWGMTSPCLPDRPPPPTSSAGRALGV